MVKFKIGDKVTLVNDYRLEPVNLVLGGIYTVDTVSGEFVILTDGAFIEGCYDYRLELYEEGETEMAFTSAMTAEQIRNEIIRIDSRIEEAKKDIEEAQEERNSLVEKLREKGFTLVGKISQVDSDKPFLEIGAAYVVNDSDSANTYFMVGTKVTLVDTDEGSSLDVLVKRGDGERDWMNSKGLTKI